MHDRRQHETRRSGRRAVIQESKGEPRAYVDLVQPLLDAHDVAKLLGGISESQVDQLRESAELPAVDLSVSDPAKRRKGLWRYDPAAVRSWWQKRENGGGA